MVIYITSLERREARYIRRCQKREKKRNEYNKKYDDINVVTDINHIIKSGYLSRNGVNKKASVQKYMMNMMRNSIQSRNNIINGKDIRQGFIEFDLHERGKARHIRAMHVKERVIQRCVCDYSLIPILKRSLVYDNGASLKEKGIHFTLFRLRDMLRKYIRKHGTEGYILLIDFSKYFDNIDHAHVKTILNSVYSDSKLLDLVWKFVESFGDKSIGIGSQVSQMIAISYPNRIDHRVKEYHKIGLSARYMDDTYIISSSKKELETIFEDFKKMCDSLSIKVNESKSRIYPIKRFTFMKVRFRITSKGRVIMLPCKASFSRMRRKLRSFSKLVLSGTMTLNQVNCSYQSWYGFQNHFNSHMALRKMDKFYFDLFGVYPMHKKRSVAA